MCAATIYHSHPNYGRGRSGPELARAATLFAPGELVKKIVRQYSTKCANGRRSKNSVWLTSGGYRVTPANVGVANSTIRPSGNLDTLVLATPAGDPHEFDLLLAALLAAVHGWRVVYWR